MLKLFVSPGSCSLACHIALEEAGAVYVAERLAMAKGAQNQPEYLAINPKARVPALVTDRGVITETPAILVYIAQSYPQAGLAPLDDAFAFAQMQAFNAYLSSTVHVAHAHRPRGSRWSDDPAVIEGLKVKVPQNMADCFALIENSLFAGPWVMGDTYTIADPYLFTLAGWLKSDGVDPARFPKVLDHSHRMAERPAVKAVTELLDSWR
ncbi:MAG: glutathione S-transferase family protein [Allorhizobium sp.]